MTMPAAAAARPTASVVVPVAISWSAPSGSAWMPWAASRGRRVAAWGLRTRTSSSVRAVSAARVDWVTNRPRAMITTWSTVWATSASTWLETSTVRPWSASCRRKPRSQWTPSGSRPLAGSSRISTWGSPSRAVARPRRWRMPSEKPPTRRRAAWVRPTWSRTWSARLRGRPAAVATTRRWLRALRPGWKLDASSTAPTWRMGSGSSRYGRPSILVLPAVGVTSPSRVRRVVVLPAPLGPRKPTTVPWSTSKLRSSTATMSPKRLVSPWMVMTAMASSSAPPACSSRPVTSRALNTARRYEAEVAASSAPGGQLRVGRQVHAEPPLSTHGQSRDPVETGSLGEEGGRGQQDPDGGGSQRPHGVPVGRPGPLPGLAEVGFLVLDAVVVVQHARLVGAGPAVTSVEQARWMVMVDQHGCSSRSIATASLKGLWSVVDGGDRHGLLLRPAGLGAAPPCGDGLAGLVLVSSGPAQQPGDGQGDHHGPGEGDADPAGELVDMAPAGTGGIAEQDMGGRPDGRGRAGPEGEDPVAQPQHAGQAGEHDPGAGGAAADDQGPAAAPQQ